MYPIEREKEILRVVDLEGKASVEALAELTGASEMTVRRDLERLEDMPVPADIDYAALSGLRLEAREKLARVRPINVGQAARVRGVTPADVNVLLLHIARRGGSV